MLSMTRRIQIMQMPIAICFVLMTAWVRLVPPPLGAPDLNITRFALFWALLSTVLLWLLLGLPGLSTLRQRPAAAGAALALLLLALWAYLSQEWAYNRSTRPDVALSAALGWGVSAAFALVVVCAARPRTIVIALTIAISLTALIATAQFIRQQPLGLHILGEFRFSAQQAGVSVVQAGDLRLVRPAGLLPHPNILGGLLAVGVLLASAGAIALRGRGRLLCLLLFIPMLWALLLTFSRAAWIGLAGGGIALLALLRWRWRTLLLPTSATLLVGGLFAAGYAPLLAARTGVGTESIELRSVADRVVYTDFALRALAERPLIGQGVGAFPWRAADYLRETFYDLSGDQVHQAFLAVWTELGVIGFALMTAVLVFGIESALPVIRTGDDWARAGLLAAALALAIVGLFDHYPYSQLPSMSLWWGCLAGAANLGNQDQGWRRGFAI